jgi:hypothetical protein
VDIPRCGKIQPYLIYRQEEKTAGFDEIPEKALGCDKIPSE